MRSLAIIVVLTVGSTPSPTDWRVVGIVDSRDASAILESGGRRRVVSVGDVAFGARVVAIGSDGVTLMSAEGRLLDLESPRGTPPSQPARLGGAPSAHRAERAPTSISRWSRADFERRLASDMARLAAETKLAAVDGGGLQLLRIPTPSLLSAAGLASGDVVVRVAGAPVASVAALVDVLLRSRDASELEAVVLRDGRRHTISVRLSP